MAYLWDSNILRHYSAKHPTLHENLKRAPISEVLIPIVVYAEQLKGRIEGLLKAEPQRLLLAQQHLKESQEMLSGFAILDLDQTAVNVANQLKQQIKTSKRHADLIIAAQTIAGRHILVTRNTVDFQD
ncbi:MAG: type II toxin-antitoxin system VapC family toxin, partial [Blastocatellia bacterium]